MRMISIQPARRSLVVIVDVPVWEFYGYSFPVSGVDFELFGRDISGTPYKQTSDENQYKQTDGAKFFHLSTLHFLGGLYADHTLFTLQFVVVKVHTATATVYRACNPPSISADVIRYARQGLAMSPALACLPFLRSFALGLLASLHLYNITLLHPCQALFRIFFAIFHNFIL